MAFLLFAKGALLAVAYSGNGGKYPQFSMSLRRSAALYKTLVAVRRGLTADGVDLRRGFKFRALALIRQGPCQFVLGS